MPAGNRNENPVKNLPVAQVGFADTTFRAAGLKCLNAANSLAAACLHRPLRIALHPYDAELKLRNDVRRYVSAVSNAIDYDDLQVILDRKDYHEERQRSSVSGPGGHDVDNTSRVGG